MMKLLYIKIFRYVIALHVDFHLTVSRENDLKDEIHKVQFYPYKWLWPLFKRKTGCRLLGNKLLIRYLEAT